jgi:hypothetical protein
LIFWTLGNNVPVTFISTIPRIFVARAACRIDQGNIDGAIEDKLTLYRWGRLATHKGSMIQYLVGIAIQGMANTIPFNANPEHPLTEQQIRRLLEGLDALPPWGTHTDVYEWERHLGLSLLQSTMQYPFAGGDLAGAFPDDDCMTRFYGVFTVFYDKNVIFRRVNEAYDAVYEPPPREKYHSMLETKVFSLNSFFRMFTSKGRGMNFADMYIAFVLPAVDAFEGAIQRLKCAENMQRLALAMLLYQCEHGKLPVGRLPDENWVEQVTPYLGDNGERFFSCASNPSPKGETTYAMVRYADTDGDTVAGSRSLDTLLLIELIAPVPIDKAIISVDEVLERKRTGSLHPGGMNVVYRNGAVRFLSSADEDKLRRSLGLEVSKDDTE